MDSPKRIPSSDCSKSPEFEFWNMVGNPSFPQPNLVSADELFVDGVLLPLHLLHLQNHSHNHPPPQPPNPNPPPAAEEEGPQISRKSTPSISSSKRWKDLFKKSNTKSYHSKENTNTNRDSKSSSSSSSAELNINIWPFYRSRSAGNRPRMIPAAPTRKVSSAPCSRSNSAGESKSRKWPSTSSPGLHLGRSSPVWQVRRPPTSKTTTTEKSATQHHRRSKTTIEGQSTKTKLMNFNVPICIGYRQHLSCTSNAPPPTTTAQATNTTSSHLFNLRNLFTKKVY